MPKRKIVATRENENGTLTHFKIEGNHNFTDLSTALRMAKNNLIEAVPVKRGKTEYIRSYPDNRDSNNFDNMTNKK